MKRKDSTRSKDLVMFSICAGIFAGVLISRVMGCGK